MRYFQRLFSLFVAALIGSLFITGPAAAGFFNDIFGRPTRPEAMTAPQEYYLFAPVRVRSTAQVAAAKVKSERRLQARQEAAAMKKRFERLAARPAKKAPQQAAARPAGPLAYAPATAPDTPKVATPTTAQEAIRKIMTDATLRPGDIVMGASGLQVVVAPSQKVGAAPRLTSVNAASKVDARIRNLVAAATRPLTISSLTKYNGTKAAPPPQAPEVERWVDGPDGKKVRFVGGYY